MNKLNESIIDYTKKNLDMSLLEINDKGDLVIKYDVIWFILSEIAKVYDIEKLDEMFIKGSSLTYQWRKETDIDIYLVDISLTDEDLDNLRDTVIKPYNKMKEVIPSTNHPIELYITNKFYNKTSADVLWDLKENKWVLPPKSVHANIKEYWDDFKKFADDVDLLTNELYRDIIDYDYLLEVLGESDLEDIEMIEQELDTKVKEIDIDLDELEKQFEDIKDARHEVFSIDNEEKFRELLLKYGSKNLIPQNVVFKLAQHYYYLAFLKILKDINTAEVPTEEKIPVIKQAYSEKGNLLKQEKELSESFLGYYEKGAGFGFLDGVLSNYEEIYVNPTNKELPLIFGDQEEYRAFICLVDLKTKNGKELKRGDVVMWKSPSLIHLAVLNSLGLERNHYVLCIEIFETSIAISNSNNDEYVKNPLFVSFIKGNVYLQSKITNIQNINITMNSNIYPYAEIPV